MAAVEHAAGSTAPPEPDPKVVSTGHPGEDMMGLDRVGGEWGEESAWLRSRRGPPARLTAART